MIKDINIRNFKCFQHLRIESCQHINIIVGDNGSGKTALLEAIFWALGSTSELAARYRVQRGLDSAFNSPARRIEEAIWRDYFYDGDWSKIISIELTGVGPEARSVQIFRGASQVSLPLSGKSDQDEQIVGAITAVWRDANGIERAAQAKIGRTIDFNGTDEDLSNFFYFAANSPIGSTENASRFSELSRARRDEKFIEIFKREFHWIEDLEIQALAGVPVIYAAVKGKSEKIPLPNISGGINRIVGVLLAIASQSRSVVLVDEMEDGIYYRHHEALWRALLQFARDYGTQLFISTHSKEWLEGLIKAAGNDTKDISLLRIERSEDGAPELFQFEGDDLKAGIEYGAEVRGGSE